MQIASISIGDSLLTLVTNEIATFATYGAAQHWLDMIDEIERSRANREGRFIA